jgi:hypothetical protein
MNRIPALRQHLSGHYYVRLPKPVDGRQSVWFGAEPSLAQSSYALLLVGMGVETAPKIPTEKSAPTKV